VRGRRADERRRIPSATRDGVEQGRKTLVFSTLPTIDGISLRRAARHRRPTRNVHNRRMPIPPRGVAACVRCRRAAQRSVWCGRSGARAGGDGASNPRGTAPRTVWWGVRRRIDACSVPAWAPDVLPSCRSVPRAGEGPSPAPTLTPPRCPWWPNRTPRTRLARPTRPACSRWWRLDPRSRARVFRHSPRVVASPDFVADASVPPRSSRLISRAATSARAR
jgi:hypothetical protein